MLLADSGVRVWLYGPPTDMRKSFVSGHSTPHPGHEYGGQSLQGDNNWQQPP